MSFAGTWMKLETIILSKLMQENQTSHVLTLKWVSNNKNIQTQRREHHTAGPGGWENWGGIALEEIPNVDDGVMDAANHHNGMFMPM